MVSLVLTLLTLGLVWRLMRGQPWFVRFAIAVALFIAFVWLSPQVYYTYYLMLFEGLPWQVVVKSLPDPLRLLKLITFSGPASLSAHSQGVLGWALLTMAALRACGVFNESGVRTKRRAKPDTR